VVFPISVALPRLSAPGFLFLQRLPLFPAEVAVVDAPGGDVDGYRKNREFMGF
jgi:hypothetical protein